MKDGVIADFEVTERLLRDFINKATRRSRFRRPRVVISVPSGVTEVEKRAVIDAALSAGAKDARVIEEPMAAPSGRVCPSRSHRDHDRGYWRRYNGGSRDLLGGIVAHRSIRVAGDEMDEAIVQHIRRNYNLLIGERTAERIKMEIGHATINARDEETMEVRGRDLVTGLPKTVVVSSTEIHEALEEPVQAIVDAVKVTLEQTPPELAADIMDRGIMLAGEERSSRALMSF